MGFFEILGLGELYQNTIGILAFLLSWAPYWLPVLLFMIFEHEWMNFVRAQWRAKLKYIMLEVKLPREIHKSPLAMEIALNALYQTAQGPGWHKWWRGRVRDEFSLEMVSIGGQIHFFIRCLGSYKDLVETHLYAQYPDIEIFEVPDYTLYVDYRGKEGDWDVFAAEYKLSKPDAYPIKTYVDFGLDKEGIKEEFKIDPLTSVIEYLGSMRPGEQLWIQIILRAATKRYKKSDGTMGDWKDEGKDLIKNFVEKLTKQRGGTDPMGMPMFKMMMLTEVEKEIVTAVQRSVGKLGFDCGIRSMYVAKKGKMNYGNVKGMSGLFRAFSSLNLNSFELDGESYGFQSPWQDYKDLYLTYKRKKHFKAYKQRSWFYRPRKLQPFVLNLEEIATIFHFPGGVAQTPTFGRIPSRKSEPPVNLPI
ncbi:MAG: hypothetical protein AAB628_01595 [Patescibacteria group bacterium]